jgi:hypothetical protein
VPEFHSYQWVQAASDARAYSVTRYFHDSFSHRWISIHGVIVEAANVTRLSQALLSDSVTFSCVVVLYVDV